MSKRYSIAEARDNLAAILYELEHEKSVEITRRGQPVAVLVSKAAYDRMNSPGQGFWNAYEAFKRRVNLSELNIDPDEVWGNVRDQSQGRRIDL
jgi:prevent-host-death family protein